ncbi:MAG: hypothetical protein Q4G39_00945 [Brachymonas sp.]|nr:hypothetical protein [Brachymonas sp.]
MVDAALLTLQQMRGFVPETLLTMFASLMITYLLVAKGLLKYLAVFSKPFTARLGLPDAVIAASLVAFGSVLSANAMLSELYHKRQISEHDTYLGAILNGTSLNVKQIFTYQLPIMMPLLGWKAGGIYLLCFITAAVIRYVYVLLHAKRNSTARSLDLAQANSAQPRTTIKGQLRLFVKIAGTYLLITFVVVFLFNAGVGALFEKMVAPISRALQLPVVLAVPMAVFIFNPIAGAAAVGTLRNNGTVNDVDAVLAVIMGSLLLLPLYGFRSGTIARTVSFFGPRLGMKVSATSTTLAIISRLIFLALVMGYKLMRAQ